MEPFDVDDALEEAADLWFPENGVSAEAEPRAFRWGDRGSINPLPQATIDWMLGRA